VGGDRLPGGGDNVRNPSNANSSWCFASSFVYLVVGGRVKHLSLKGLSLFPILGGRARRLAPFIKGLNLEFLAHFFSIIEFFPPNFLQKKLQKKQLGKKPFIIIIICIKNKSLPSILRLGKAILFFSQKKLGLA
jgi:hypothetical protein